MLLGDWKLIESAKQTSELYDLRNDPMEKMNHADDRNRAMLLKMRALLQKQRELDSK